MESGELMCPGKAWVFVRNSDGSLSVFKNDELLYAAVPQHLLENRLLKHGLSGAILEEILRNLQNRNRVTLEVNFRLY